MVKGAQGNAAGDVEGEEDRPYSGMGVMVMACKAVKKLLGYELCLMEPEGTLFHSDSIAVIRKTEYTEIFNLETMQHEIGDNISRDVTRRTIYQYIKDHRKDFGVF